MTPHQWGSPCGHQCTHKYAALMQIPWRVFCKKGCDADGETWEECLEECNVICYKDPVLKDQQWSACIDRSPGVDRSVFMLVYLVAVSRPPKPPPVEKPPAHPAEPMATTDDILSTSA
ncbi:uncharacterized protein LOC103930512 isoform X2 [Pyrus x bretschneideri]|uniref:uncharacterized protein LOC103930512 isoform X2 n=1 Tax=Pyrus x bretschneideri TaxID=225117 RepID=UPI00202E8293|nr:uncharacterized protein LOC103930512 isoform X2 [Pyrus x bretschneideri]